MRSVIVSGEHPEEPKWTLECDNSRFELGDAQYKEVQGKEAECWPRRVRRGVHEC